MAAKVTLLPHPVQERFLYTGETKAERVVCVGRWSDETQKRPHLMMAVVRRLLETEAVEVEIVGTRTEELERWHTALPGQMRERVSLRGRVGRNELPQLLATAQIFYSPSAYESFGIAAGEALCSGCSVVAAGLVSMGSFEWFAEDGGGTLADRDNESGHTEALLTELAKWREGVRKPSEISRRWASRLHERVVAERVLELVAK
jgi:glycosyltransferase involved in cell wall biosynthesis